MSRVDLHDKFNRSVRLLLGLRHIAVRRALAPYSLTDERIAYGWSLVSQAGLARVESEPLGPFDPSPKLPDPLIELDAFQKRWFPIARGLLAAAYPEIGTAFFGGLAQERGTGIAFMVTSFLDRLHTLARGDAIYGPDGPAARLLLAERGLSPALVESAERALEHWDELYGEADESEAALAAEQVATAKLWAFYLEWSSVASIALTNGTHLRWLGLAPAQKEKPTRAPQHLSLPVSTARPLELTDGKRKAPARRPRRLS